MSGPSILLACLLILGACSVPPQSQKEAIILPISVVADKVQKEIKVPPIKQTADPGTSSAAKPTADTRCPTVEGETEQQRIIRKLDCLLGRD